MSEAVFNDDGEAGGGGGFVAQLPGILWQRKWLIAVPLVVGSLIALLAAFLIPTTYRSTAVMLVESQQLPDKVTGEDNTELVDRRIARIRQQISSRPDLIALIEEHGLYPKERRRQPLSETITTMREAIVLEPTKGASSRSNQDQTIAFKLSFDYAQPAQTQAVAQDLMERVLQLDARGNSEQATNTVQFLTDQAAELQQQIAAIEGQLAGVNARNGAVLAPGGVMLGGSSGSYDVQIASLQRDNATLVAQRDLAMSADTRDPVVVAAETQLAAARAVYAEGHPDVVIAKQRLAQARELAKSNNAKVPLDNIDRQIAFNNSQISALRAAQAREQAQISATLHAQARAPLVQQQVAQLQQRLAGLNEQYEGVSARLLAAQAGVKAEDEQMGERLSVVEPPVVPDTPIAPNRLLIAALGIGGGLALGLLLALVVELILRPIRGPEALAAIVGRPALGIVPVIRPRPTGREWRDRLRFRRKPAATRR